MDITLFYYGWVILLVVLGIIVFLSMLFRIVVQTNEVHIVQSKKSTDPYGKWFDKWASYYNWPAWVPVIGIERIMLPVSIFTIELNDYQAYDLGKVPFVVDVKAWFRVEEPRTAGQRIANFNELRTQLDDILRGAIRKILASSDVEEIMAGRWKFGWEFKAEVESQAKAFWVTTENIELMDIRDPDDKSSTVIQNIMEKKKSLIEKQSRIEVATNKKEAEIAEINAKKEADIQDQNAMRMVWETTAEKEKLIGIANEKAKQDVATEAKITKEKDMEVLRVADVKAAEITKQVEVVKAEQIKQTIIIEAEWKKQQIIIDSEWQKQQKIIDAEGVKQEDITIAEWEKTKMERMAEWEQAQIEKVAEWQKNAELNRSQGIEAVGKAEAEAKRLMELAPVMAQIELAKEIWSNSNYMEYLLWVDGIKAGQVVGVAKADALKESDLKVIANGQWDGTVDGGINGIMDIFSGKGGSNLGTMLETLKNTPAGEQLLEKLLAKKGEIGKVETGSSAKKVTGPSRKIVDSGKGGMKS